MFMKVIKTKKYIIASIAIILLIFCVGICCYLKLEKVKKEEAIAKQQRIENYKQHSRNILYKTITSINNLIKGHSHPNFTESHQQLLCISITNKVNEILNENKLLIQEIKVNNINNAIINGYTYYYVESDENDDIGDVAKKLPSSAADGY